MWHVSLWEMLNRNLRSYFYAYDAYDIQHHKYSYAISFVIET